MSITISRCQSKADLKRFESVPELLHKNDPYFVPPFPGSIVKLFDPKKNSLYRHGDMVGFIASRDGQPVGRIALIINESHNHYHHDKMGFFGFFDSIDDQEVAKTLFQTVRDELKKRDRNAMRGPYNPDIECGLLIEGFDSQPFILMPYNPPYYLKLYEAAGMVPARDLAAYYLSADETPSERIRKITERVKKSNGLTVRNVDMKNLKAELRIIRDLYNVTLDRNWGFVPLTYEDLESIAEDLKMFVNPEMVLIAEKDGKPVGFSLTFPNINEFLAQTKNSGTVARILKFAWKLKTSHPTQARLALLGVAPEYRGKGLAALFYYETLMRGKKSYIGGEMSWIDADNEEIVKGITVMGGKKYKSYRIYESILSA